MARQKHFPAIALSLALAVPAALACLAWAAGPVRPAWPWTLAGFLLLEGLLALGVWAVACRWEGRPLQDRLAELEGSEGKFRALFHGNLDAIFVRSLAIPFGQGRFVEVNDGACRRLGYSREELLAADLRSVLVEPDEEALQEVGRQLQARGSTLVEARVRTRDGAEYPAELQLHVLNMAGQPVVLGVARDISERRQAQDQLKKSLSRLQATLESTADGILVVDAQGRISDHNKQFAQMWGLPEDVLARNDDDLALDYVLGQLKAPDGFLTKVQELYADPAASSFDVLEFWDGKVFERYSQPQFIDGAAVGRVWCFRDITEQKRLQNQLRHSQKLEAVGQLAGGVAHDFNNILQVINGYGTLIHLGMPESDPNRASMGEILKAGERAAQLTRSLLAFSRKQVMDPRIADLNTIVGNVEKFLRRVIGEDVQLKCLLDPAPLKVQVDISQLEQVIMNLATNARDAMPGGGTLSVTTSLMRTDGGLAHGGGFILAGHYALLTMADTGEGMDEDTLKRVFDPFYTTKEMGRGTGLGLATVYGIIKQHKGYITAHSEAGQGTAFRVYLPIADRHLSEAKAAPAPEGGMRGAETILVAEDEPAVRGMVAMVLEQYGYTVLLAQDGQEAVEQFHRHRPAIKLILMDIIMPRKSGRQAYDEIRQDDPGVKVLFTSGYTADFIKSRGDLDQGMELVMKPVQPLELVRKVRELLDR